MDEDEIVRLLGPAEHEELADIFNTVNYGEGKKLDKGKGRAVPSVEQEHSAASSSVDQGKDFASPIRDKTNERKDSQISNIGQAIEVPNEIEVTEVDDLSASPPESMEGVEGAVTVSETNDINNLVSRLRAFPTGDLFEIDCQYANDPLELRFRRQTCKLGDLVLMIVANLNHLNDLGDIRQISGPDPASDCFNTVLNTPQRRKANHYLSEANKHIGIAAIVFASISSLIATMETHYEGLNIEEQVSEHIAETTGAYESAGRSYYWALCKLAVLLQRVYPATGVSVVEKRAEEVKEILAAQSIQLYRNVPVEDQ